MPGYLKAIILLLTAGYIIMPMEILPDFLGIFGRIDDFLILFLALFYLKHNRFPSFQAHKKEEPDSEYKSGTHHKNHANSEFNPYKILGIEKGATEKEILSAYRKESQKYHPDKVQHLGKDLQDLAELKFLEIYEAYSMISKTKFK